MAQIARPKRSTFQKIQQGELERIGQMLQQGAFDVLFQRMFQPAGTGAALTDLTTAYLPNDCKVSYVSGDRSVGAVMKIATGIGFKRDDSEADADEPNTKPIHFASDTNLAALSPSDGTNPRIDRIFARPQLIIENPQTVDIINPSTEVVTATAGQNQNARWGFETTVATGTPAASPTAPPVPVGWLATDELAQVTVQAGSGSIDAGDIADQRLIYDLADGLGGAYKINNLLFGKTDTLAVGSNLIQFLDFTSRSGPSTVLMILRGDLFCTGASGSCFVNFNARMDGVDGGAGGRLQHKPDGNARSAGDVAMWLKTDVAAGGVVGFDFHVTQLTTSDPSDEARGALLLVDLGVTPT